MIALALALLLMAVLLAGWVLTLLGMPGNWLMVAATAAYAFFGPADSRAAIGWQVVASLAVLAALGELLELLAGAAGTARAGGGRRAAMLALAGSLAGGIVGLFIGLPIPLAGPVLAALLFAGLGAMAGAMLGEMRGGKDLRAVWQIGRAAFWGRMAGTLGKLCVGAAMLAIVAVALVC